MSRTPKVALRRAIEMAISMIVFHHHQGKDFALYQSMRLFNADGGFVQAGRGQRSSFTGKLLFVDFAGYQRLAKTMIMDKLRKDEAKHINLSLSALADVIHNITFRSKHIPGRNGIPTRILNPEREQHQLHHSHGWP
jgi:hypothetical protein